MFKPQPKLIIAIFSLLLLKIFIVLSICFCPDENAKRLQKVVRVY